MKFFILEQQVEIGRSGFETDVLSHGQIETGPLPAVCETCGRPLSMLPWLPPIRVVLETWGSGFGDLAGAPGGDLLISERFRDLIVTHDVRGFSGFEPVEVVKVKRRSRFGGVPPKYFRVTVDLTNAAIDPTASGLEWGDANICPACLCGDELLRWRSVVVVPDTWSGEDVFIARGLPGTIVASERFKAICDNASLRNVVFVPTEEYEHDFSPSDNIRRAREIIDASLTSGMLEKALADGRLARLDTKTRYLVCYWPNGEIDSIVRPKADSCMSYWESL